MILLWLACAPVDDCFQPVDRLEGDDELIYDLAWSPSGDTILTGGLTRLRLVAVSEDGLEVLHEESSEDRFNSVVWTADGRHVLIPTGDRVRILEVAGDQVTEVARVDGLENAQQRGWLSQDESRYMTCDDQGLVRWFEVGFSPPAVTLLDTLDVGGRCTRVALSPDGTRAMSSATGGLAPLIATDGDRLEVLDTFELPEEGGDILWSQDWLLYGTFGDINRLYSLDVSDDTVQVAWQQDGHLSGLGALDLHPDGQRLLTGEHDHTVRLVELHDDGFAERAYIPPDGRGVHSARFSPDGRWVARTAALFKDHLDLLEPTCLD